MKKLMIIIMAAAMVAGCGKKDNDKKYQGAVAQHDYVAEGFEYLSQSDPNNAIRSFDRAIKEDPSNMENYLILGQVYLRLNQQYNAIDTFMAATNIDPHNGEAQYFLALSKALAGYKEDATIAAQASADIFLKERDKEKFARAIQLLKNISEMEDHEVMDPASAPATR